MAASEELVRNEIKSGIFVTSLIAGGAAGICVDTALFPLDTIKTRLQSQYGFLQSGGFRGLYKGILPVLIGSAPTSALFFLTYEGTKAALQPNIPTKYHAFLHMGAASLAELVACTVRVPVEVTKQRKQAFLSESIRLSMLYRGYWSTVLRDMPFSLIQFPLWEFAKKTWNSYTNRDVSPLESAICGAIAGSISAGLTTPLDVAKTRIMLAKKLSSASELKIRRILREVYKTDGVPGLFAGVGPRIAWIFLGGLVFFGAYEETRLLTTKFLPTSLL